MDTRKKILSGSDAAKAIPADGRYRVVSGYFDPLQVSHAQRLGELAEGVGRLIVVIRDPAAPLLPARARAELVAGLEVVDYVVLPDGAADEVLSAGAGIIQEETVDEQRTRDFILHVQKRY